MDEYDPRDILKQTIILDFVYYSNLFLFCIFLIVIES